MSEVILFAVVVILGVYCLLLGRRTKGQAQRIEQLSDRLYSWGAETRSYIDEVRGQLKIIEMRSRRTEGENVVTPDMLISDILAIHPRMKDVLASMHLGGCNSCSVSSSETLGQGAASYGLNIDEIMAEIDKFLSNPDGYVADPKPHGGAQGIQIQIPERTATEN
ncbi:MAG: DUF1858 domain-containing protein [Candidatus Omnitrophica bacterium]|nr:DUF1858 domain-containing protein [Candidatus Omnitrophota bacterium]MCA9440167.1 DUF1858 domain-containing protein [Candidatus Omnitrophota bacterium]